MCIALLCGSLVAGAATAASLLLVTAPLTVPAQTALGPVVDSATARSPELSETTRLSDRSAMPEIVPGPDFGANIDRLFTEWSMVMQAWGAYGVLWAVIHQWLGVSPRLGRGRLAVVPQLPAGQAKASANTIKLGVAAVDH